MFQFLLTKLKSQVPVDLPPVGARHVQTDRDERAGWHLGSCSAEKITEYGGGASWSLEMVLRVSIDNPRQSESTEGQEEEEEEGCRGPHC